jgi:hypothetical protein
MRKLLFIGLTLLLVMTGCIYVPSSCGLPISRPDGANLPPTAYIDSITPPSAAPGEKITLVGHGTDTDGTVVAYRWRSSIGGDLGAEAKIETKLDSGSHIIYLKVQDNNGAWSDEVRSSATISGGGGTTPPSSLPAVNSFSAAPASILVGAVITLSWNVSGATTVFIDQGVGVVAAAGSTSVAPGVSTSYTLTATNSAGSVTAATQVVVNSGSLPQPQNMPVINSFAAAPANLLIGGSSILSWNVSGATSVVLDPGAGGVNAISSKSVSPGSTTSYTLTASNAVGWVSQTIVVTVTTVFIPMALPKTITLNPVSSETGSVYSSTHAPVSSTLAGDTGDNKGVRAYFSYDISSLAGKNVTSAKLTFVTQSIVGNPWPDLVGLWIGKVNYGIGALQSSDYNLVSSPLVASYLPAPPGTIDVTPAVHSAASAGNPRFQVRAHFAKEFTSDGAADYIMFSTTNTTLTITYYP